MTDFILHRKNGADLAYTWDKGDKDFCVLYLHGWTANRKRKKGLIVQSVAQKMGWHYVSLDYTAHGESSGDPADFTIGQGIRDTRDVIEATVKKMPMIIVGNSIGGWFGLWLAETLKQTIGFVGLAPAPDITEYIWNHLMPDYARQAIEQGDIIGPSVETMGFCFTPKLFQDAKKYFMLTCPIDFNGPVSILVGDRDDRVKMDRLTQIKDRLTSPQVIITCIKGADHHLSDDWSLRLIEDTLTTMIQGVK